MKLCIYIILITTSISLSANSNDDLLDAAIKGNLIKAKAAIKAGADVNYYNNGSNPLIYSASNNHLNIVKHLIFKGAEIDSKVKSGYTKGSTALMSAASKGYSNIVRFLLKNNANKNIKYEHPLLRGKDILIITTEMNQTETVKLLISSKIDINVRDSDGNTPLIYAASNGNIHLVKLFQEAGLSINLSNNSGETALMKASEKGHLNVVKYLIENGAILDAINNEGNTALYFALKNQEIEISIFLLNKADSLKNDKMQQDLTIEFLKLLPFIQNISPIEKERFINEWLIIANNKNYPPFIIWLLNKELNTEESFNSANLVGQEVKEELISVILEKVNYSLNTNSYYSIAAYYSMQKKFEKSDFFLRKVFDKNSLLMIYQLVKDRFFDYYIAHSKEKQEGIIVDNENQKKAPTFFILDGHNDEIKDIKLTEDEEQVVTSSGGKAVVVLDSNTRIISEFKNFNQNTDSIKISPDAKTFLTGNKNTIKIWSTNGEVIAELNGLNSKYSYSAYYSPDGKKIITHSDDGTIKIWNIEGKHLLTLNGYHLSSKIAISPNGKSMVIIREDDINVCNLKDFTIISIKEAKNKIKEVMVSPDNKYFITINEDGKLIGWTIKNKRMFSFDNIKDISISRSGKFIALSSDNDAMIISIKGEIHSRLKKHKSNISGIFFSLDEKYVITFSEDNVVKLWNLNGKEIFSHHFQNSNIENVKLLSNGEIFISTEESGYIYNQKGKLKINFKKHIENIEFSSKNNYFITSSENELNRWDRKGKLTARISKHSMIGSNFSSGKKQIITFFKSHVCIRDFEGRVVSEFDNISNNITKVAITLDGSLAAVISYNNSIKIWDIKDKKNITTIPGAFNDIAFSSDGKYLIGSSKNPESADSLIYTTYMWDVKGNVKKIFKRELDWIENIAYSLDGMMLAFAPKIDPIVKLYIGDKNIVELVGHKFGIEKVAFSNDGKMIATGSWDQTAKIWNSNGKIITNLIGHSNSVSAIQFSPSNEYIATGSWDNSIRIWDLKGNQIQKLDGHNGSILSCIFLEDEKVLITSSSDNTIKYWDWKNGKLLKTQVFFESGDWFEYTPDNYFDASANGAQYMNIRKENEVFGVDQFAVKLNRPDILLERMGSADKDLIEFYRKKYKNRLKKYIGKPLSYTLTDDELKEIEKTKLSEDFHVPDVNNLELTRIKKQKGKFIPTDKEDRNAKFAKLKFKISDSKEELKSYNIFINDVPLYPEGKDVTKQEEKTINVEEIVELTSGENKIEVSCMNQKGTESFRDITFADYDGKEKGNLYYIGFGVSDYEDEKLNLKFADKDIEEQAQTFKKMETDGRKVFIHKYTNKQVTVDNIKKVKELLKNVTVDDTVILSISGHGAHEKKEKDPNETYYFITHETNIDQLKETAANFELIEDILEGTKENPLKARKKLFLMDTCESGEIDDDTRQSLEAALSNNETAKKKGIHLRSINLKNGTSKTSSDQNGKESDQKQKVRPYVYEKDRFIHNDLFRRTGAIVFSSSRGGEFSQEQDNIGDGGSGVFSYCVINALKYDSEVADKNKDGYISIEELKEYVMKSVPEQTSNTQHPTVDRDNLSLKILFPVMK